MRAKARRSIMSGREWAPGTTHVGRADSVGALGCTAYSNGRYWGVSAALLYSAGGVFRGGRLSPLLRLAL
jgi:hypothetical protein